MTQEAKDWKATDDMEIAGRNLPNIDDSQAKTAQKLIDSFKDEDDVEMATGTPGIGEGLSNENPKTFSARGTIVVNRDKLKDLYWLARASESQSVELSVPYVRDPNFSVAPLFARMPENGKKPEFFIAPYSKDYDKTGEVPYVDSPGDDSVSLEEQQDGNYKLSFKAEEGTDRVVGDLSRDELRQLQKQVNDELTNM